MRALSKMILTTMVLVSFSSVAKSKPKTAILKKDKVEQLVLMLDQYRVQAELGMPLVEGDFPSFVLDTTTDFLKKNGDVSAAHIDARFRKLLSPIRLFAVERTYFPSDWQTGQTTCLIPIESQSQEPTHALSVVIGDKEALSQIAHQYGIKGDKQNAKNLQQVGVLTPCVNI